MDVARMIAPNARLSTGRNGSIGFGRPLGFGHLGSVDDKIQCFAEKDTALQGLQALTVFLQLVNNLVNRGA